VLGEIEVRKAYEGRTIDNSPSIQLTAVSQLRISLREIGGACHQ
jgi:hypothetical protein